jgi:hypothetical protein
MTPLRIVLVHPGSSVSTSDVHRGLFDGLRADGHEVYEFALDARIERSGQWLTYCWKKGKKAFNRPTSADILYHAGQELVARALRVQPDVVLVVSAMYLHPDVLVLLRRARLRVAILLTESPYDDEKQKRLIPWADVVWTNERTSAKDLGIHYLPHAWHPDVHARDSAIESEMPAHDVVFVGTGFEERIQTLSQIDFGSLDVGLYGTWELLGSRNPLRRYLKAGYISNKKAAALYRKAKVGLNLYRTSKGFGYGAPKIARADSLNPRAYELAATGCFTISDYRPEVAETFGDLVPTFTTPADASALIHQWVQDDAGRARVQAALPATVSGAIWPVRSRQMVEDLARAGIVPASRECEAVPA